MGIDYAYFAAADDEFAPAASSRSGGPLRWPVVVGTRRVGLLRKEPITESLGPAVEGFAARGYDLVLVARRDDRWLATWSQADAVVSHPIDPPELAAALVELLRRREAGLPVRRAVH